MKRYSWSKAKPPTGLALVTWNGQNDLVLRFGRVVVGHVSTVRGRGNNSGWYYYGSGFNSLWTNTTFATRDEAKSALLAYVKAKAGQPAEVE